MASALSALLSALGCGEGGASNARHGDVVATLPGPAANITIEGDRGIVAGYHYVYAVDLATGAIEQLPGLDARRWLSWAASQRIEFVNDEFFHARGGKGYFPAGHLEDPVIYELDLTTGEIRDLTPPAAEAPDQVRLLFFIGASSDGLYAETAWPDIRLWEVDTTSGIWHQVGGSWGRGAESTGPIYADDQAVYFGKSLATVDGSSGMVRWDRATKSGSTLARFSTASRISADREHVYVAGSSIERASIGGGNAETLHRLDPLDPVVTGLVLDGEYLYFTDQLALKRLKKQGGQVEVLASRELPGIYRSLRIQGRKLYWLDSDDTQAVLRSLALPDDQAP